MADIFGSLTKGFIDGRNLKKQNQDSQIDNALKYAQLAEAGYNVRQQPKQGMFGGGGIVLERDPSASTLPSGFVRVGGKAVRDPDYLNPLQKAKMSNLGGDSQLTAGQRLQKDKATQDLFGMVEQNNVRRQQLEGAKKALPNVPQGFGGKLKVEFAKRFNPNDPMLSDWQKIKMIGTDAQLLQTALTKGAISDKEMSLLAQSAANDDIMSAPRLKPVIDKLEMALQADEQGRFGAYQKNYGEDPRTFLPKFGQGAQQPTQDGYQIGQIIPINGIQYRVIGGDPNDPDLEPI